MNANSITQTNPISVISNNSPSVIICIFLQLKGE